MTNDAAFPSPSSVPPSSRDPAARPGTGAWSAAPRLERVPSGYRILTEQRPDELGIPFWKAPPSPPVHPDEYVVWPGRDGFLLFWYWTGTAWIDRFGQRRGWQDEHGAWWGLAAGGFVLWTDRDAVEAFLVQEASRASRIVDGV